ncbi:MAG: hypothetical protein H7831_15330 [Magnetococcus sp. WYHC-3]
MNASQETTADRDLRPLLRVVGVVLGIPAVLLLGYLAYAWVSEFFHANMEDLVTRDGLVYHKEVRIPFSGVAVEYFKQKGGKERVRVLGHFDNGRRHGKWIEYKWNGERVEENYDNGRLSGEVRWYYTGNRLQRTQEYSKGVADGYGTYYNVAGEITRNVYFENGTQKAHPSGATGAFSRDLGWWENVAEEIRNNGKK